MADIVHVNSIAYGFLYAVSSFAAVVNSSMAVELEPLSNEDINVSPWVGLYIDAVRLPAGPISAGQIRDVEVDLIATVRVQNAAGRLQAMDALYRALGPVLTAVHCNYTLSGAVQEISSIEVAPLLGDKTEDDWIQAAHILITAVTQVQ